VAREVSVRRELKLAIPSVDRSGRCVFWRGQNAQIWRVRRGSGEGQIGGLRGPRRARFEAQRARFEASEPLREPDWRLREPSERLQEAPHGCKKASESLQKASESRQTGSRRLKLPKFRVTRVPSFLAIRY
jgi:hypothetical protein